MQTEVASQVALTSAASVIVGLAAQQAGRPDLICSPKRVLAICGMESPSYETTQCYLTTGIFCLRNAPITVLFRFKCACTSSGGVKAIHCWIDTQCAIPLELLLLSYGDTDNPLFLGKWLL
jgi:hypothetical protein